MSHIAVRGLTKRYANGRGVHDLSFDVAPGRIAGLIGPNGSGKSTTIHAMVGLVRSSGRVTYDGRDHAEATRAGDRVGVQLDAAGAHPRRTGRAHLRALATGLRVPQRRADELLEEVGLAAAAGRAVGTYSMGMRQRLGLAGALLPSPSTLVLDEPTNGLDPHGVQWLAERLTAEADAGVAVLVSSHALADLQHLVDDLVLVGDGQLRFAGPIREVVRVFGHERVVVRVADGADRLRSALAELGRPVEVRHDGSLCVSDVPAADVGLLAHRLHVPLLELTPDRGSLHSAYLAAFEESA
jgi:ABC-2 type transport system ATP-binding protein